MKSYKIQEERFKNTTENNMLKGTKYCLLHKKNQNFPKILGNSTEGARYNLPAKG